MRVRLTAAELREALDTLPGWEVEGGFLQRRFAFSDFEHAMVFMNRVAEIARRLDHHPDWCNVYNRVDVRLQTHDAGGITITDVDFARRVNALPVT
jgi:4a-hydroxytetrahydrobiopterin dehydratase